MELIGSWLAISTLEIDVENLMLQGKILYGAHATASKMQTRDTSRERRD